MENEVEVEEYYDKVDYTPEEVEKSILLVDDRGDDIFNNVIEVNYPDTMCTSPQDKPLDVLKLSPICELKSRFFTNEPYNIFSECCNDSFSFLCNEIIPKYKDYQLLGDSQLLRFAEQILNITVVSKPNKKGKYVRSLPYCISGLKIEDLEKLLHLQEYPISDGIILLIGTNNILYNTPLPYMCSTYKEVVSFLSMTSKNIILLTVPPIPRMQKSDHHWERLKQFNSFVMSLSDSKKVTSLNLATLFISYDNQIELDYFEKTFNYSQRTDLIHLNLDGLKMLQSILDIKYFNKLDKTNKIMKSICT